MRQIRLGTGGPTGSQRGAPPGLAVARISVQRMWRGLATVSRTAAADALHTVLPSDCRLCGGPMMGLAPVRVCDACLERVRGAALSEEDALCARCGDALGMESARFARALGTEECTVCRLAPPPFAGAVAFAVYDAEMRELLHQLKFGGMRRVAEHTLGEAMALALLKLESKAASDAVVVPVPLFRDREKQRGFNQAGLLARAGVKRVRKLRPAWKLELRPEALSRVKDTRALHALRPDQRRRGLKGAFAVENADLVRGREVVLVDDILTTGATARECAKVLLRAGAAKVWVATVARAQPESVRAVEVEVARWGE